MTAIADALIVGRQAADILEAPPLDPGQGYSPDELAGQYAATDRLAGAFRKLDQALNPHRFTPKEPGAGTCATCGKPTFHYIHD